MSTPRLPIPGSDDNTWGDLLNEYLSVSHDGQGNIKASSLASKADTAVLTTKGDIYVATGASSPTRLGVGLNGTVLTADSTSPVGMRWTAPQSMSRMLSVVSSDTTAGSSASTDYIYIVTTSNVTITLPTAVSNTNIYKVKNGSTGSITVAAPSSQTIDGSPSISLTANTSVDIVSDGADWRIV